MKRLLLVSACASIALSSSAQVGGLNVDTRSNIFGYGVGTPSSAGGGGLVAPVINLAAGTGRIATFSASGSGSWGSEWPVTGPDGIFAGPFGTNYNTNISGVDPISGFAAPRHGHLVGVFLEAGDLSGLPAPSAISYPTTVSLSAASFAPQLRQVFFIGDGLTGTGSGSSQQFLVPDGAVKLALGIADSFNFAGPPSYYNDNSGSYSMSYNVVPEPVSLLVLLIGVGLVTRKRVR